MLIAPLGVAYADTSTTTPVITPIDVVATSTTSTSTQTTIAALNAQIASLMQMIQQLEQQVMSLAQQGSGTTSTSTSVTSTGPFSSDMHEGEDSNDVKQLQQLLASDPSVYPQGLVTGYYGPLTKKAVEKFQEKHGISPVGTVGPETRAELNKAYGKEHGDQENGDNGNSASSTNALPQDLRIYRGGEGEASSTESNGLMLPASTTPVAVCHNADHNAHTLLVPPSAVHAFLAQGDTVGACTDTTGNQGENRHGDNNEGNSGDRHENQSDNNEQGQGTSTTTPDVTAPVISGLGTTVATTTADIVWTTNEGATSAAWVGTTTPVTAANAFKTAANVNFATSHSVSFDGLTASTTYYYFVTSADASGNVATSTEGNFVTQ